MPDYVIYGWQGVLAPTGTPPALIEQLSQAISKALATPELKARLSGQGTEPAHMPPAEFQTYITAERKRWGDVIRSAKIRLD